MMVKSANAEGVVGRFRRTHAPQLRNAAKLTKSLRQLFTQPCFQPHSGRRVPDTDRLRTRGSNSWRAVTRQCVCRRRRPKASTDSAARRRQHDRADGRVPSTAPVKLEQNYRSVRQHPPPPTPLSKTTTNASAKPAHRRRSQATHPLLLRLYRPRRSPIHRGQAKPSGT